MICSQCHASSALQPSLIGLPLADELSADGSHQTWLHARVNEAFGLLVHDIEVSDVQMTRVLASTLASVSLEQHGTFVVLIKDIFLDWISLHLKE